MIGKNSGKTNHSTLMLIGFLAIVLASLSCTLPNVNRWFGLGEDVNTLDYFLSGMNAQFEDDDLEDSEIFSDAIRADKSRASKGIIDGWWICRDVAGEISLHETMSEVTTYGIKGIKLISTKLDMTIQGLPTGNIKLWFNLDIEQEEAIIDAATETISGYQTLAWTKMGSSIVEISENGGFSDTMEVVVVQRLSGASTGSYESKESHAFFGLIPPDDLSVAFICDRSAQQIPEGLENLTPENFLNYCHPGYYYECDRQ
jgi:hypothetical protein